MPYTEFRKSYGDFEVVIHPVDLKLLTTWEAGKVAAVLRSYKGGFICDLVERQLHSNLAEEVNTALQVAMSSPDSRVTLGLAISASFKEDYSLPFFGVHSTCGVLIRKLWCEHMAGEIEREFRL